MWAGKLAETVQVVSMFKQIAEEKTTGRVLTLNRNGSMSRSSHTIMCEEDLISLHSSVFLYQNQTCIKVTLNLRMKLVINLD